MHYLRTRKSLVRYVKGMLETLRPASALTMTIEPAKYEGYFVTSATGGSLVDTETPNSLKQPTNT